MSYEEAEAADRAACSAWAEADEAVRVQQEKVAKLRGECGRLRKALQEAHDALHAGGWLVDRADRTHLILSSALFVPFSEEQG